MRAKKENLFLVTFSDEWKLFFLLKPHNDCPFSALLFTWVSWENPFPSGGHCSFVGVMGRRTDKQSFCPGAAAGASVHQIPALISFLLHLSVGPALLSAVDGWKGPQTERENGVLLHWRLGTQGLPSSQSPYIWLHLFNSYSGGCTLPFTHPLQL